MLAKLLSFSKLELAMTHRGIKFMNTNIHKHLLGMYSVFSSRINLINASIGHNATQGQETEKDVTNLLADFLPSNFGLGSGVIIDTLGNTTKQIDIIIYDKNKSDYTLSKNSKIFLADHVIAAIEIKTTYTNSSLVGALSNIESVKKLKVAPHNWIESDYNANTKQLEYKSYSPSPPLGIVFFFQSHETQSSLDMDAFFKNLKFSIDNIPLEYQPDLLFSLDHAAFFRHNDIGKKTEETSDYLVSLVQGNTDNTKVVNLADISRHTKALIDFGQDGFLDRRDSKVAYLNNDNETSQMLVFGGKNLNLNPTIYRVAKIQGNFYLLDLTLAKIAFLTKI